MSYKTVFGMIMMISTGNVYAEGIRDIKTLNTNFFDDKSIRVNLEFKSASGDIYNPKSCEDFYEKYNSSLSFENNTPSSNYSAVKSALAECIVNKEIGIKNIFSDDNGINDIKKEELPKYLPADFMLVISNNEKQSLTKDIIETATLMDVDPSLVFLKEDGGTFIYKDNQGAFYYVKPMGYWHKNGDKVYLFKLTNTLTEGTFNNTKFYYLKKTTSGFKTLQVISP